MRIAENDSGSFGFSKKLKMSFMVLSLVRIVCVRLQNRFDSPPSSLARLPAR